MSSSNSCPTCGEHLPVKFPNYIGHFPMVGDIVVCELCAAEAEIIYINEFEPDFLEMDFANAEERGTA